MNPTPERILEAARILFSEQGFERTTIRGIGASAGVDPALVVHYFGNKENLFFETTLSGFEVPDLRQMEGRVTGKKLIALLRASVSHPGALHALQGILQKRLQRVLAELLPVDEADLRSGLIATQMVGLAVTRYILRIPSVVALTKDEIVRRIGPVIQHYLFSHMADATKSTVIAG
ncbi:TetR family transcriptional regulator [Holophaga foetida]|uniref:TetR/AcrR family transcriptional regulator n=1 Tax=Holophaga foetida TaxID=35839 RepID=UPI00130E452F|nr:TetR family transcriptional regulator [Holophaga foetida]